MSAHAATATLNVPFLDLKAQYLTIKDEIETAVAEVMSRTAFAGGPFVEAFEEEFARYCGTQYAIGVGNGTEALWFALLALGIGPGDEVITAANTFIATAEAISFAGATPVLVDVDEVSYNVDPAAIEAAITPRTRAIMPVHLYGQMAAMGPIRAIAKRHGLALIEDASQAHGAQCDGQAAGSVGDLGCFSFYPGKNLGAYGEAGAVVTSNREWAEKIRRLRDHGQKAKYYHQDIGWNGRMDGIQGAILSVKLRYLDRWNAARRAHAARYGELLAGCREIVLPVELPGRRHVYHLYVVRVKNRDAVLEQLKQAGVHCGIHYPVPIHRQDAYAGTPLAAQSFPVTERLAEEILSLPMYAELSDAKIQRTCDCLETVTQSQFVIGNV